MDRRMKKEEVVHIFNGILLSLKNKWNYSICSNTDGQWNYHTNWNADRERQIYHLSDTNELIYNTWTDSQNSKTNLQLPEETHGGWWVN